MIKRTTIEPTISKTIKPKMIKRENAAVNDSPTYIFNPDQELMKEVPDCREYIGTACKIKDVNVMISKNFKDNYYDIEFKDGSQLSAVSGRCLTKQRIIEGATALVKGEGGTFENAGTTWKVIAQNEDDTVIVGLDADGNASDRYVVAWGLQPDGSWNQGHYFNTKDEALKFFNERAKKTEAYNKAEFAKKREYCTNDYDVYYLRNNKDNYFVMKKGETPWEHKELTQTDIEGVKHLNKLNLNKKAAMNESIEADNTTEFYGYEVTPYSVLPPFKTGLWIRVRRKNSNNREYYTFVNDAKAKECYKDIVSGTVEPEDISDIALGYTSSDYGEQLRWLDYADNFTPYKKPLEESPMRMSDDYFVGDMETGRIYHGIGDAMNAVKSTVTKTGEVVTIQNVSLADEVAECKQPVLEDDKHITANPAEALKAIKYEESSNQSGEVVYHSDELYSPDIAVFGDLIEVLPLTADQLPLTMTVEDHGKLVARLAQVQKVLEDLK